MLLTTKFNSLATSCRSSSIIAPRLSSSSTRTATLSPSSRTATPSTTTTVVTRASADTKSSSTGESSSNPWAQPGYLGAVVSSLPEEQQRLVFAGILVAIGAGTAVSCSVLGPAISAHLPSFLQVTRTSWFPLGPIFMAAGVAHFTESKGFCSMYPHQGAWGLWSLPGERGSSSVQRHTQTQCVAVVVVVVVVVGGLNEGCCWQGSD